MDLFIIIILIIAAIIGYRRGLILQFMHLVGTLSAIVIAILTHRVLAAKFDMILPYPSTADTLTNPILPDISNPELAYYRMGAFIIIFIVSKIVIQIIVSAFDYLQQISALGIVGEILGIILSIIETLYILLVLLFIVSLLPLDFIHNIIEESSLAQFIIKHTFILSDYLKFILNRS